MKLKIGIFLLCLFAVLSGIAIGDYAPRPHVDQGLYDQRLPRQLVLIGDEQPVIWYQTDGSEWYWFSIRSSPSMVTDVNYLWPIDQGDANSVLLTPGGSSPVQLVWATVDANLIDINDTDPNIVNIELPTKTPWNVMFADVNGFPLTDDPNNFTYYEPNTAFGIGLDNIAEGIYSNNFIQVYSLLDFHPTLFNTTIGMGSDDTTTGPNNVRIGYGAGAVLDEGYENTLGGKDAGQYLVDSNDNTGWGYKVIGGNATIPNESEQTYKFTYISESGDIWGIPVGDGKMTGLDADDAVNVGGGIVGLPFTGHPFATGDTVRITGTINYNGQYTLGEGTSANELQITETYVAETFDGKEVLVKQIGELTGGAGRMDQDADGNLYYVHTWDATNSTYITKIETDGTLVYDFFTPDIDWSAFGGMFKGVKVSSDSSAIYFYLEGSTGAYITLYKFNLTTGEEIWSVAATVNFDLEIDDDDNVFLADDPIIKYSATDGSVVTTYTDTEPLVVYEVCTDNDLDIMVCGGRDYGFSAASLYNLSIRTLDNSDGATLALGGTYYDAPLYYTYLIATGNILVWGDYIYVLTAAPTWTIYKLDSDLNIIDSVASPTYAAGFYIDLYDNLVVVNQDYVHGQEDVLWFYDEDLNYLGKIENMYLNMLKTWNASVGGSWIQGDAVFDGALAIAGGPNVHRVTALGAYAASNVYGGADDGLYLGTYAGAYNETDPNRFFLDNLDRGDYIGDKAHSMMYGRFANDANDQWLNINADVNIPLSLNVTGYIRASRYEVDNATTYIDSDGSNNMTFTDAVTGTKTLAQLGSPTYLYIKATTQSEGDLNLSDGTNWGASKAYISTVRIVTSATDWDLYLLQNDNGYSTNDATIPRLMIANEIEGNANLKVDVPYEDEDDSDEVHLYYLDNSGANTADIYVIGYSLN